MRYFLSFLLALTAGAQTATLEWQYSSNTLAVQSTNGWPYIFKIYGTNQLGSSAQTWPVVYASSNTPVIAFDGTNYTFAASNVVFATNGQYFYTATVSNFWGESGFSNTSSVPPLPLTLHTIILKN